ncbi:bifunctional 23S rRNA (guanine(2069)-N(7))-methyltransferase RlmK/23S rRNA (guanine(2445)-N(2))-methyltransferase RlmL [Crenothrix polyspora]|uniref:Ribosomal RNA large subunit methyltransferase K/L n=1 Tax=Crenothrix polyspora TaxID=360316 RepID=A0A1R4H5P0_9GAMM|nr:bifunctional 23S rRNA (guanine(2069)-N(7))-methyltransferase RlmK/23S rRNA (guanine(2445)-N(2))-methyltransferase RlmL [Crenothrix polyspora]SJM91499.1 Ribosomal RNA large subunit methyltransferase K/L (Includes: 23S rRNA m2G2445 methyltransferase; 23S rRNA m7G2069 methyltransferase) [Crenothrix polyspora]
MPTPTYELFASTPKAMEDILAEELKSLGVTHTKTTVAGVAFQGDLETAYRTCLWSRTANRILLILSTFSVTSQDDLYNGIAKINWFEHLEPTGTFAVTFNVKNSEVINNSHFGALKVKDAIVDQMRKKFEIRPSIDTERPSIRINVHLHGEKAQLSLDLSGESLHRRGYRDISISAPIKENLAAAMLLRSGWPAIAKQGGTLLDPMCGSGTLLLEGAMMAADFAPGLLRDYFGFLGWKKHDATCWEKLIGEAEQRKWVGMAKKMPVIVGFDQDRQTVHAALGHINNARLHNKIHIERRDISDAKPAEAWQPGLVICNPPYGERLGDEQETAELYTHFGETLKTQFIGWKAALIISNPELGFRLGIRSQKPITLYNGALECRLLRLNIEEKAFFTPKAQTQEERIALVTAAVNAPEPDQEGAKVSAEMFANRLKKNLKKWRQWAKQNQIRCYRVYDADLPEYAVAVDVYEAEQTWINVQEYEPPKSIDQHKADQRLAGVMAEIPGVFGVSRDHVFLKIRRRQRKTDQYEKFSELGRFHTVEEGGCKLRVNFEDYLDTGLFLDHRPIRMLIQQQAQGKRFLNLFAYTGSATVHAALGGAKQTTTIDMSNTYINWAKANMALNNQVDENQHQYIQADCLEWLETEARQAYKKRFDLIFLDPPTFSNSKRMEDAFDIQENHVALINNALALLAVGGMLYFSTNFRRFKFDHAAFSAFTVTDISAATVPADFTRNSKIHYCWSIKNDATS